MNKKLTILSCLFIFFLTADTFAQKKKKDKKKPTTEAVASDAKKPDAKKEPKPYVLKVAFLPIYHTII